ncbi:M23 family metallopeptidase [Croceicoccus gelatinilyticus]|uniref:M23 family metallopeptidase n=1 Tax=Croceicoccus gelatinilyticus TaxID=2835536 RepID=UPI001BCE9163|nr:M23 family metallopeptidase [Croceicoccus gelatinilyticus]MBS7668601.1 M23 family metallopeptidase [Croceicoccus gelatinilyticus]
MSGAAAATAPAQPSRLRRFGRDLRIVLVTAGLTSLAWIVVLAFAGVNLFAPHVEPDKSVTTVSPDAKGGLPDDVVPIEMVSPIQSMEPLGALRVPVEGVAPSDLIDSYDDARGSRKHEALDIMAPTGTPVVAAAEGTVEKLFLSDDGGKTIYVRSADGATIYYYAHLDKYAPGLEEGGFVRAGQRIGTVGATGNADASAPHLHFAVMQMTPDESWWEGTPQNPYPLLSMPAAD